MRVSGTITYEGGRTETFEAGAPALADWELYAMRHGFPIGEAAPPMLSMLVVAYHALGIEEGFDVWRKSVVDFDADVIEVPPTLPAPTVAR